MKLTEIALNHDAHGMFLDPKGSFTATYEDKGGVTLTYKKKKYAFGHLMWPHYEFQNQIGYLTNKLMSMGKAVHLEGRGSQYTNSEVSYKPCAKMTELLKGLESMENTKGFPMRFMHVISRSKTNFGSAKPTFEMVVTYSGHYVSGSYIHDYTAAADYTKRLKKKFPKLEFEWLGYDSSNDHAYAFKFYFTI